MGEIKVTYEELQTAVLKLSTALDAYVEGTNTFISGAAGSFSGFNSDFTEKIEDVLYDMSDEFAQKTFEKVFDFCNGCAELVAGFQEVDTNVLKMEG